MLKPLTRDILVTLIIKCILLILLWFICFKDVEKPPQNKNQWLFGSLHAKQDFSKEIEVLQ